MQPNRLTLPTPDLSTTNMSDELQRRMDKQSKYEVFEVVSTHPAYSDHGEQARDIREGVCEPLPELSEERTAEGVISYMCKMATINPILPGILVMRLMHPDSSLRELCPNVNIKRSVLSGRFKQLVEIDEGLRRFMYGDRTRRHDVQTQRRKREQGPRQPNMVPCPKCGEPYDKRRRTLYCLQCAPRPNRRTGAFYPGEARS